jgi:CubicO group peptidase (beta-lactamase class C family)
MLEGPNQTRPSTPGAASQSGRTSRGTAPIPAEVMRFKNDTLRALWPQANEVCFYHAGERIGYYKNQNQPDLTNTHSCTKSMVAIAIFKARDLQLLELEDKISDRLPEWKHYGADGYKDITIRHLLTHTSGLPGNAFFRPEDKPWSIRGDDQFFNNLAPVDERYDRNYRASLTQLIYPVGKHFDYSNPGVQILAAVLERALRDKGDRRTVEDFIKEEILRPLRMTETTFLKDGRVIMFNGGMHSTGDNLFKMGDLVLQKGFVNGRQILSPESVEEMISTPPKTILKACPPNYGHLWWRDAQLEYVAAVGDNNNLAFVFPKDQIIITRTQHYDPGIPENQASQHAKLFWDSWNIAVGAFKMLPPLPSTSELETLPH